MMTAASSEVTPIEFTIELWGGVGEDYTVYDTRFAGDDPNGTVTPINSPQRLGGAGGYTKLDMIVPPKYTLQLRPGSKPGGAPGPGEPTYPKGGACSEFFIDNEWMCVVGGGGGASAQWQYTTEASIRSFGGITGGFYSFDVFPGRNGEGGISGQGFGSVSQNGESGRTCINNDSLGGFVVEGDRWGSIICAGTGAGLPAGQAQLPICTGHYNQQLDLHYKGGTPAGRGNIRINADKATTFGYLSIFTDISMVLNLGAPDFRRTQPLIKITNKETGNFREYTSQADVKVSSIRGFT